MGKRINSANDLDGVEIGRLLRGIYPRRLESNGHPRKLEMYCPHALRRTVSFALHIQIEEISNIRYVQSWAPGQSGPS